jgi:hypothetical protein
MSNAAIDAVAATSIVASTSVELTNCVSRTVTPAGSVVPDLKKSDRAPGAKFLPLIFTTRESVPCSPLFGFAAVTRHALRGSGARRQRGTERDHDGLSATAGRFAAWGSLFPDLRTRDVVIRARPAAFGDRKGCPVPWIALGAAAMRAPRAGPGPAPPETAVCAPRGRRPRSTPRCSDRRCPEAGQHVAGAG